MIVSESRHTDLLIGASLILSFIAVLGFRFEFTVHGLELVNTLSFVWLFVFLFLMWAVFQSFCEQDCRLRFYSFVFGIVIAAFYSIGLSFEKMEGISWIWAGKRNLLHFLNFLYSYALLYYCFGFLAFRLLRNCSECEGDMIERKFSIRKVLVFWALLLAFYIPWYLYCYPGVLTYDSSRQIRDALDVSTLDNHHSALLDLMIRAILLPIKHWTGSVQIGIGACTFLQMLTMTFIFALTCERISHYLRNRWLFGLVFLWYAAYPVNNIYSVTMWKDILFSGCFLAFVLCLDRASSDEDSFFSNGWERFFLFLTLFLLPMLRHNGILISAVMAVCLIFYFKKSRRIVVLLVSGALFIYAIWRFLFLPALDVKQSAAAEYLSLPIQQIARTLNKHHGELHPNLLAEAESYFNIPEIWTFYSPILSDPVKSEFNAANYEEDPARFFSLWKDLGIRYPVDYLEAAFHNNYGYWFPETTYWISSYGVITGKAIEDVHTAPIWKMAIVDKIYNWYAYHQDEKMPLLPLLFSRGACFWLWIFCGIWCLYKRRNKFILFFSGLCLWGSVLISPVYNEYRYVYGLFIALPLIMASSMGVKDKSQSPGHLRSSGK